MKQKQVCFQITELFAADANGKFFYGIIERGQDDFGKPFVLGRIEVNGGYVCSRAKDQWELGEKLDSMVLMVLDKGLHSDAGKTIKIFETDFFLN